MSRPLVTICVPTFNRSSFLTEGLQSLCDQGLAPDEYLVAIADNASTDDTPDVVNAYRRRLNIVYHRNESNLGMMRNVELALGMCESPYLVLLPDDDLLAPGQLSRALRVLQENHEAGLVSSLAVVQSHPGSPRSYVHGMFLNATGSTSYNAPYRWDRTEWLALALIDTPLSLIGSVFRTETFRQCQLYKSYRLLGDRMLLAEAGAHGTVMSLPWVGGYYRVGDQQNGPLLLKNHRSEFRKIVGEILRLCDEGMIPVTDFWVQKLCMTPHPLREYYLTLLRKSLPIASYRDLLREVESKLQLKPTVKYRRKLGRAARSFCSNFLSMQ